ncbi:hypothetical protein WMF01_12270 [Sorangium sp. So ce1667]
MGRPLSGPEPLDQRIGGIVLSKSEREGVKWAVEREHAAVAPRGRVTTASYIRSLIVADLKARGWPEAMEADLANQVESTEPAEADG